MKKFVTHLILFSILILGVIFGCYAFWFTQKQKEVVKIPKQNIIIGDSNTRWAINDSILSEYSNFSTGGETYLFAYTKLKVLEKNNKIDTLLLSFSPHNIINNPWWNDADEMPIENRMPAFYQDYSLESHEDLLKNSPKNYILSLAKIGKTEFGSLFSRKKKKENDLFRFGSYLPSKINETQIKRIPYNYKKPKLTEIEVKYLKKIIDECNQKNIHLILIQTPKNYLRDDYKNYDHKEFYEEYYLNFKNVDFLDFSKFELPKNAYWDINHVDIVGAEFFSNFLEKESISKLLYSKYNLKK